MDIEGAEEEAIKGAKNIIIEKKPILAISIYHNANQFLNTWSLIKSLVPGYKLYLRMHSTVSHDTVLYAIPSK